MHKLCFDQICDKKKKLQRLLLPVLQSKANSLSGRNATHLVFIHLIMNKIWLRRNLALQGELKGRGVVEAPQTQRRGPALTSVGHGGRKMHPTPLSFSQQCERERGEGVSYFLLKHGCGCVVFRSLFEDFLTHSFSLLVIGFVPHEDKAGTTRLLTVLDNVFIYFSLYLIIHLPLIFVMRKYDFPFSCNFISPTPNSLHSERSRGCHRHRLTETARFIGLRRLLHIPPQREAPCFYMNEHGWVVRKAEWWKRLNLYYTGKEAALWYQWHAELCPILQETQRAQDRISFPSFKVASDA